jgi:hypothetical protein
VGADSTRLSITGRYRVEQTGDILPITANMDDWRFVRAAGESLLERLLGKAGASPQPGGLPRAALSGPRYIRFSS